MSTPKNQIKTYFNCRKCFAELPEGQSMREYSRTQTGWTPIGIQVWCVRHDIEVVSLVNEENRP